MADNDWLLAVSKEEVAKKLADFAGKHPDLKNRFILAETNQKKLKNVLSSYAHLEADEEAVILYDDTLLGGGRTAFLSATRTCMSMKHWLSLKKDPVINSV